jgi:hypothetical protein
LLIKIDFGADFCQKEKEKKTETAVEKKIQVQILSSGV